MQAAGDMNPRQPNPLVKVSIFNQNYTLRAKEDPHEVEELARSVDQLMNDIATRTGHGDSLRIAVLASLHLADRLQTLERELNALRSRVDEKSAAFSMMLEQVLDPESAHPENK
jgi:cell division protein ZapA